MLSAYEWSEPGLTFFGLYPETAGDQGNFLFKPGGPKPQQLSNASGFDADPSVSPDGKWLAYASTETGRFEVYVTTMAPSAAKKAVTNGGGVDPKWSRNGKEIFYVHSVTGELMSVELKTENGLDIGARRRIHPGPLKWGSVHSFSETPDGSRFLVWTFDPDRGDITVLLN